VSQQAETRIAGSQRVMSYRGLDAWKKGMSLAKSVYETTASWPAHERYGLTSQIRRAEVSVPCNVAEGQGRLGKAEMRHHLSIAHGSLCEVETLVYLAGDIGLIDQTTRDSLLGESAEVGRIVRSFIMSLDRGGKNGT
jgi:four helix bundle protein